MKSNLSVERLIKIASILDKPVYSFFEVSPHKINNQNNYDSSVNYIQDFDSLYQESKDVYEKLENAYKESIQNLKEENAFLKKLLEKDISGDA